ncbi:ROK family protein [Vulcanococcus sp. Clear-D1]|uniref:ROK family protein n=1 Tax=Vulcanococcus sp. Clear-D1 TaxID=2766970 RepID=UPI001998C98A|nr:ROK family protein [Vulcanococcus sp. Clear-D1]MBD1195297.1 ROK family protein [Vulcanococcus sp. Clear-D1]
MAQLIGVDLGGTAIKLGRFTVEGQLLAELEVPTPQPPMPGAVVIALVEAVQQLDPDGLATCVGVGLPGPMDGAGRVARICINLTGWEQIPLAEWLEPQLQRRVTLANDGNCAVVGEAWQGAARGYRDVLLLTLGTGVGGGVLLGGSLFTGHGGAAAEPGLICIDPEGPACNSGNRGSLEQFCSIGALARESPLTPQELCRLAGNGDAEALAIWRRYGRHLGVGLSSLIYVLTPELVLIGGGLSAASEHFLPAALAEVEQRVQRESRQGLELRRCALGNGAGRLGAARLALDRLLNA